MYYAYRILRASRRVTPAGKHVWALISELDQPKLDGVGGCFMGEQDMAIQLGLDPDSVADLRRELVRWQLVHKEDVAGSRGAYWFPRFPRGIEVRLPPQIEALSKRTRARTDALRAWVAGQRQALDDYIAALEGVPVKARVPARERTTLDAPAPRSRDRRHASDPVHARELVAQVPGVAAALARAHAEEPPLPDVPPGEDDDVEEGDPPDGIEATA